MSGQIKRAAAAESEHFADAFSRLEPEVCDLTRMARLAELQLHEAVGELSFVDGDEGEQGVGFLAADSSGIRSCPDLCRFANGRHREKI